MRLLEAVTTPSCTSVEQPLFTMEGRIGSPIHVEDVRRTSPALGIAAEVMSTALMVPSGPSTAILPSEDGPKVMAHPSLDDSRLGSPRGLERVDTAEFLPSGDGARIMGSVGSSGAAILSLEVPLGQTGTDLELGLFLRRGLSKWLLSMETSSEGLKNSRPSP